MPTYEYQCRDCEHEFEAFQSMSAARLRECPRCRRSALVRLIGMGAAVIVRGTSTPCHPSRRPPRAKRRKRGAKREKPWYRSGDRIDPDTLKDPDHYIHTGEIGASPTGGR